MKHSLALFANNSLFRKLSTMDTCFPCTAITVLRHRVHKNACTASNLFSP